MQYVHSEIFEVNLSFFVLHKIYIYGYQFALKLWYTVLMFRDIKYIDMPNEHYLYSKPV